MMYYFQRERSKPEQKASNSMKNSEDRSDGGIRITDNQVQIHLAPDEAYALWQ